MGEKYPPADGEEVHDPSDVRIVVAFAKNNWAFGSSRDHSFDPTHFEGYEREVDQTMFNRIRAVPSRLRR